jgi:predicted O-methyltransferase YrrM
MIEVFKTTPLWESLRTARDMGHGTLLVLGIERACFGKSVKDVTEIVMTRFGKVIMPYQDPKELTCFIERVAAEKPKVVLEIGTARGGTLFLLSRVADPSAIIISLDLPGGKFGGGYPAWKSTLFRKIVGPKQTLHLIRGNSHEHSSFEAVSRALAGRAVDVLFIDADHSYEGVKTDLLQYQSLVRPGGIVGFHDIIENKFDREIDVARFWNEIKKNNDVEEIVTDYHQGRYGIGLIRAPVCV